MSNGILSTHRDRRVEYLIVALALLNLAVFLAKQLWDGLA